MTIDSENAVAVDPRPTLGPRFPKDSDMDAAQTLLSLLSKHAQPGDGVLRLLDRNGEEHAIPLPPLVAENLLELTRILAAGQAVTLVPVEKDLTTQQAADILNVSRPYLIDKLLGDGPDRIPYGTVGRHRRIRAEDLFAFKSVRDEKRARALDDLMAGDADLI